MKQSYYSMPTNFPLELREPPAREVFIFGPLVEREGRGGASKENGRENGPNLARHKTKQRQSSKSC